MARDTFSPNRKTYLSWEVSQRALYDVCMLNEKISVLSISQPVKGKNVYYIFYR